MTVRVDALEMLRHRSNPGGEFGSSGPSFGVEMGERTPRRIFPASLARSAMHDNTPRPEVSFSEMHVPSISQRKSFVVICSDTAAGMFGVKDITFQAVFPELPTCVEQTRRPRLERYSDDCAFRLRSP